MGRLHRVFADCAARGERALITYLTAGDPDLAATTEILGALAEGGADIVEIGIPFSDPLMDGPVIQVASERALAAGATPRGVMTMAAAAAPGLSSALIYMTPYNLVWRYGLDRFAADCQASGICGVLITDLPPEEAGEWQAICRDHGVGTVFLAAPTSSAARMRAAGTATGFVYLISRRGVTGEQAAVADELAEVIGRLRQETDAPVAVGFGLSTPEQVAQVCALADGAIVGSALVKRLAAADSSAARCTAAREFARALKAGTVLS